MLFEIPELEAHQKGRGILPAFQNDVGFVTGFHYSRYSSQSPTKTHDQLQIRT